MDLFQDPLINFKNLKNDEMASVNFIYYINKIFKLFDREKKGSFSAEDFLFYYK